MSEDKELGCARPTGGPVGEDAGESTAAAPAATPQATMPRARIGKKAPDFVAPAFVDGAFKDVKLSDYLGGWVVLCFYPGDFTFV